MGYEGTKTDPNYRELWADQNIKEYKEAIYDRISRLLIEKFAELKPHIKDGSIKTLQKTFRDGSLQTGRESTERMVIYQSDSKANADDSGIMNTILTWLEFTHPNSMNLEIQNFPGEPTNIVLKVPGFSDLNINNIVGALDLGDLSLKDNVSQFINIQLFKNKIDRSKLSAYIDTEFSELSPQTFVHLIEKYQKIKKLLPFYRYRIEDFFEELGIRFGEVPIEYLLEKFFDFFEIVKNLIPDGTVPASDEESASYLIEQLSDGMLGGTEDMIDPFTGEPVMTDQINPETGDVVLDENGNPVQVPVQVPVPVDIKVYSQKDVQDMLNKIDALESAHAAISGSLQAKEAEMDAVEDELVEQNAGIPPDEESFEYDPYTGEPTEEGEGH